MTFNPPSPGNADVASYLISGLPWVSSSAVDSGVMWRIDFPYVTSQISVHNASAIAGGQLAVGFTSGGVMGTNRFVLSNAANTGEVLTMNCRVKTLYLRALTTNVTASVYAGLTTIIPSRFPILTGSVVLAVSGSPDYFFTQASQFFGYDGVG